MTISIKLLDSFADIQYKILNEIAVVLNKKLTRAKDRILADVRKEAYNQLMLSDTYTALLDGGTLAIIFGFPSGTGRLKVPSILYQLCNIMEIDFTTITVVGSSLSGGLTIKLIPSDLESRTWAGNDYIRINDSYFFAIPWLRTLLFEGDLATFALNYDVHFEPGKGRSGGGVMVRSTSQWMVPAEYAGTVQNNWFTRELQTQPFQDALANIIRSKIA